MVRLMRIVSLPGFSTGASMSSIGLIDISCRTGGLELESRKFECARATVPPASPKHYPMPYLGYPLADR